MKRFSFLALAMGLMVGCEAEKPAAPATTGADSKAATDAMKDKMANPAQATPAADAKPADAAPATDAKPADAAPATDAKPAESSSADAPK